MAEFVSGLVVVALIVAVAFRAWMASVGVQARARRTVYPDAVRQKGSWDCKCGSKNPITIDYCLSCRRKRSVAEVKVEAANKVKCPHCGANNSVGNLDCFACGKQIRETASSISEAKSKEEIYRILFKQMAQKSPSDHFASGAVFDISRQQRAKLEQIARNVDVMGLLKFWVEAYGTFCNNPQIVGLSPDVVNVNGNDTDPRGWNADIFTLDNGDAAVLCYMPVRQEALAGRIIGIILSSKGDGYYYCMLDKDENVFSDVKRNKAMLGVEKVGEVKGRGFELMEDFLKCIKENFYSAEK